MARMLRGFTYIKTGTEYKITQKVSSTNNHLSHQHVKWVVLVACLIFLLTQKRCPGVVLLMTALHCYVDEALSQKVEWYYSYYIFVKLRQM